MIRWSKHQKRFCVNCRGSIAPVFALSFLFVVATVGLAIDGSRVYSATSKLNAAADAAALAAAKLLDDEALSDSQIEASARKFFEANAAAQGIAYVNISNFDVDLDRANATVTIAADASVPTTIGQIAGITSVDFKPLSKVVYRSRKIELSLVLDTTGSMAGAKLDALKTAAKDLVDTLFMSAPRKNAVKVALVPYAAAVNAGDMLSAVLDPAMTAADGCVVERQGASAYTNDPPGSGAYLGVSSISETASYSCPPSPVVPLTDIYDDYKRSWFKSQIDDLVAEGATAGHLGTAWGWYLLSPEWSWPLGLSGASSPRPYDKDKVLKIVILMTDGSFNAAYKNGGLALNGTPAAKDKTIAGSSGYQALQLCDAMRNPPDANRAIQIYTVAFQAPANAEELLRDCSGDSKYYGADNASQLSAAFQNIALHLNSLRLTQ